jgi:galactosylxylosylprotein 3-beta-galactosyltransferase
VQAAPNQPLPTRPRPPPPTLCAPAQTGFTTDRSNPKYDYAARRAALRATWFPPSQRALDELQAASGLVVRFVIGHSADAAAEGAVRSEAAAHGGFLRLPLQEGYDSLTNKTLTFLRHVAATYDAAYVIKADDDVYLRLDRVPPAVAQWGAAGADYVGCMKTGPIYTSRSQRWFEPQYAVLGGKSYFAHCWGTLYALSGGAAAAVAAMPPGAMRFFANEDVTVGAWMLALNVRHLDDRRLCQTACNEAAVAVYDMPQCAGLCDAAARLPELHAAPQVSAGERGGGRGGALEAAPAGRSSVADARRAHIVPAVQCNTPATRPDGTLPTLPAAIDFTLER